MNFAEFTLGELFVGVCSSLAFGGESWNESAERQKLFK